MLPAALSEKLRERESERVGTWEGKTGAGSVGERERETGRERQTGTKQDRLILRRAGTVLLSHTHTHTQQHKRRLCLARTLTPHSHAAQRTGVRLSLQTVTAGQDARRPDVWTGFGQVQQFSAAASEDTPK